MWSDASDFKTDFDQSDLDKRFETDQWIGRLRELLEQLLREPYWITRTSAAEWEILYKPDRFKSLIAASAGSVVVLAPSETDRQTYYIAASALTDLNEAKKGFMIKRGDMEVILSQNAVSEVYNDAVIDIKNDIKRKTAADYYLRVSVNWSNVTGKIDGDDPLSRQVAVFMDIVGISKTAAALDAEIYADLNKMLETLVTDERVYDQVMRNVTSDMTDVDFVKYIEGIVNGMKKDYIATANSKLIAPIKRVTPVMTLDKPLIITVSGIDPLASVLGYSFFRGTWQLMEVMPYGDRKALYSYTPGTFIFAGRVIRIDGIEEMKNGGNIGGIAGKYGLDDFLGADGVIDMNIAATRFMVVSSIARMAGAPRGSDAYKWLKDKMGITVSSRNGASAITTEEAVYLSMLLYEAKSKTKVSTIKIRNQNATANIAGISENYKPYIKAAFETGIYNNAAMKPKSNISIKTFFEMLGRLDTKLKL
jgi:hypothetical protein